MELYTKVSYLLAEQLTKQYSTSFSMSSKLFDSSIRKHVYAIYGLVRIADEIVDTYKGKDAGRRLEDLLKDTYSAIESGYSTNPIVHAFAVTAQKFGITRELIDPFFDSMAMDLKPQSYDEHSYKKYIHGSAEVVGLMCLRVFVNDAKKYTDLRPGAESLGAAYQKVNFLRDMRDDYQTLGRLYFPGVSYDKFSEADKSAIIADIDKDFSDALPAIKQLPASCQKAVLASYLYYKELLNKLQRSSVNDIKSSRIRIPNSRKLQLLLKVKSGVASSKNRQ